MHILLKATQPVSQPVTYSDAVLQCNYSDNYYGDQLCQIVNSDKARASKR